jgi:hypothetical protein
MGFGFWNTAAAGGNRTHILCIGSAMHNHCATALPPKKSAEKEPIFAFIEYIVILRNIRLFEGSAWCKFPFDMLIG